MQPTCTNGAKQHFLYVCIVIKIKLLVTWLLDLKHCPEKNIIIIIMFYAIELRMLLNLVRILESINSIDIHIGIPGYR